MDIPKKVITITKLEINKENGRHVIGDQEGNSYSFFQTKQDGNLTKAMDTFTKLDVKENSNIVIAYKVSGQYQNILWFEQASPEQIQTVPPFTGKKAEDKYEEKQNKTRDDIAWLNAKSNASLLHAHHPLFKDLKPEFLQKSIEIWTRWFFRLERNKVETKDSFTEADIKEVSQGIE